MPGPPRGCRVFRSTAKDGREESSVLFEGSVADFLGPWKTFSTHRDRLVPKAGLAPRFTRREQSTKGGGMDRHRVTGDTAPHSHTCSIFPHHHVAIEHLLCAWTGAGGMTPCLGEHDWGLSTAGQFWGTQMKCKELSLSSRGHSHVGDPRQGGSPGQ